MTNSKATAWRECVTIPTYEVGAPEKAPMFLEKRVYQGSSGVVYPYPVIESVADTAVPKEYDAVYMENEYIKVMVLPELGGRVQMAYDKIARRHFVYYNSVIKPALVGLAGPWISGGIEFNWPQHHRPSTYMPVDCDIERGADGSVTVWVGEIERMNRQKGAAGFTLRPGCAYLEIRGRVSNPTDLPQTFLWWANPAVAVNDHYQSVFPPDINAVFDHGKRAVSSFPIATGTYYKMDYSAGVDISNYRNIKVPTSYMGVNSKFDFEGGYENDTRAGMLHVSSHHVSPGKKQWTWGNGDFGRAWDRNLTDSDGPYIELMAGVFTENQPDFTWLQPYEEKRFTQYFFPYRELGVVKNASRDLVINVEPAAPGHVTVKVFATRRQEVRVVLAGADGHVWLDERLTLTPEEVYVRDVEAGAADPDTLSLRILSPQGRELLSWTPMPDEVRPLPDAAEAPALPADTKTVEQLYLTGLHLEQYRHATYSALDYYEEGLRRDSDDVRCNNAVGLWYIRRCRFEKAEPYLRRAVAVWRRRNPNPYDGEPLFNLALCLLHLGQTDEAYDLFAKAAWNAAWKDPAYLNCARIDSRRGDFDIALENLEECLVNNARNHQALALRAMILHKTGRDAEAIAEADRALAIDPFNFGALWARCLASDETADLGRLKTLMRRYSGNYDATALALVAAGLVYEAIALWELAVEEKAVTPMTYYYMAWAAAPAGDPRVASWLATAREMPTDYCFPNSLEAVHALRFAIEADPQDASAPYYLGLLYYDKRQYDEAIVLWRRSAELRGDFPLVWRNLALALHNVEGDADRALEYMERACALAPEDPRLLMELDQLRKRLRLPHACRLDALMERRGLLAMRDDLWLEAATLLNQTGSFEEARRMIASRRFHPWEGGEGKVSGQYQISRVERAKELLADGSAEAAAQAARLLEECLVYPENLGEGKLYGAPDNDFNFWLGEAYAILGDADKARHYWELAAQGALEPSPALYYNDASPDKIFYQGLALLRLGRDAEARSRFHKLVSFGEKHLFDKVTIDYFAVSLPDLLIWNDDLGRRSRVHCLYMMALGYAGLGDTRHRDRYAGEVAELDINHQGVMALRSSLPLVEKLVSPGK